MKKNCYNNNSNNNNSKCLRLEVYHLPCPVMHRGRVMSQRHESVHNLPYFPCLLVRFTPMLKLNCNYNLLIMSDSTQKRGDIPGGKTGHDCVRALCPTTISLWLDMSKFCSANVGYPAVICSPASYIIML